MHYEMPDLSTRSPKKVEELIRSREPPTRPLSSGWPTPPTGVGSQEPENNPVVEPQSPSSARLVQDTAGHVHYIGPSGSLSFFAELRELVSSYRQIPQHDYNSQSKFAMDNIAMALETEDRVHEEPNEEDRGQCNIAVVSPGSMHPGGPILQLVGIILILMSS